jgi:hypothetical protein
VDTPLVSDIVPIALRVPLIFSKRLISKVPEIGVAPTTVLMNARKFVLTFPAPPPCARSDVAASGAAAIAIATWRLFMMYFLLSDEALLEQAGDTQVRGRSVDITFRRSAP